MIQPHFSRGEWVHSADGRELVLVAALTGPSQIRLVIRAAIDLRNDVFHGKISMRMRVGRPAVFTPASSAFGDLTPYCSGNSQSTRTGRMPMSVISRSTDLPRRAESSMRHLRRSTDLASVRSDIWIASCCSASVIVPA